MAWLLTLGGKGDEGGLTLANAALVMAVLTVAVALVDWLAGVTTSVAAALALNYFHTEPYRTLRVTDSRDVWSIVLLLLLGLSVSAASAFRVRRDVHRIRAGDAVVAGQQLTAMVGDDRPAGEIWSAAIAARQTISGSCWLASCDRRRRSSRRFSDRRALRRSMPTSCYLRMAPHFASSGVTQRVAGWFSRHATDSARSRSTGGAVLAFASTVELALDATDVPVGVT